MNCSSLLLLKVAKFRYRAYRAIISKIYSETSKESKPVAIIDGGLIGSKKGGVV